MDERVRFRTQSPEDRGKPHVFHAGIGKHAFEVALPDDEEGGDQQRDHPQRDQQIVRKILKIRRRHIQHTDDPEEGAVQQCAGKQRRDGAGRFTVGVRQPGMEGSQTHFCAVARKHEDECGFEPGGVQVFRSVPDRFHIQSVNIRIRSRHGHGDGAEKGEGDPHGTDQQILPHGFQRTGGEVVTDQGRADQGRRFHSHPEQTEVFRGDHHAHGRQKRHHGRQKHGLPKEQNMAVAVCIMPVRRDPECCMNRHRKEEHRGDRKNGQPQIIEAQPVTFTGPEGGQEDHSRCHNGVEDCGQDQDDPGGFCPAVDEVSQHGGDQRDKDEKECAGHISFLLSILLHFPHLRTSRPAC